MGSDCAWIASIAVECSNSRFFPVESSARRRAAALLCDALSPAAAAAAAAAEDLEGLLPFSSASSLAAYNEVLVIHLNSNLYELFTDLVEVVYADEEAVVHDTEALEDSCVAAHR